MLHMRMKLVKRTEVVMAMALGMYSSPFSRPTFLFLVSGVVYHDPIAQMYKCGLPFLFAFTLSGVLLPFKTLPSSCFVR